MAGLETFRRKQLLYHSGMLSRLALRYLSVPTNSVDAERSVSQYTTVSAPQRQRLSTSNLANQVIIAKNSKLGLPELNSDS